MTDHAVLDLKKIPRNQRDTIHKDLKTLESNPFPKGNMIKRLKGFRPSIYRKRSGDFRMLYRIEGEKVTILRFIDRKDLELILKRLKI